MIHGSWPAQVVGPHVIERFCLVLVAFRPKAAIPGDQKSASLGLELRKGRRRRLIKCEKRRWQPGCTVRLVRGGRSQKVRGRHGAGLLRGAGKVGGPAGDSVSSERVSSCA